MEEGNFKPPAGGEPGKKHLKQSELTFALFLFLGKMSYISCMNKDLWICVEVSGNRYLRPMNHANCESIFHEIYEKEANEKKILVSNFYEIGRTYNIKNLDL